MSFYIFTRKLLKLNHSRHTHFYSDYVVRMPRLIIWSTVVQWLTPFFLLSYQGSKYKVPAFLTSCPKKVTFSSNATEKFSDRIIPQKFVLFFLPHPCCEQAYHCYFYYIVQLLFHFSRVFICNVLSTTIPFRNFLLKIECVRLCPCAQE